VLPYQCRRCKLAFLDNSQSKYSNVYSTSVLSRHFVTTPKSLYPCIKKDRIQLTTQQTHQPTPQSKLFLETLAVSKLLKKVPALYTACTTGQTIVLIISQINPVYALSFYSFNLHFNIILPSTLVLPSNLLPLAFPITTLYHFSSPKSVLHTSPIS